MIPLLLALAAFHVPITCDMTRQPPPWDNAVGVYHNTAAVPSIQLRPFICNRLVEAVGGTVGRNQADAVFILAHEFAHSLGVADETMADCVGGTMLAYVAAKIGVPAGVVNAYWAIETQWREQSCDAVGL